MSNETTDRIREALEAWIAEDRPGVVRPPFPLYLDDARTVAALLRTPSGEGEAQKVEAVLRRWNRLAGDVEGSDGPLTETEIAAISRDVAAAFRSEAPGEELTTEDTHLLRALADDIEREERGATPYIPTGTPGRLRRIADKIAARRGEGGGE